MRRDERSSWNWFPHAIIGALLFVVIVNAGMIYFALHTFPGAAGEDGFDLGRAYGQILDGQQRQLALGWRESITVDSQRRPVLRLVARDGTPIEDATVLLVGIRAVGPEDRHTFTFDASGGVLQAAEALGAGQWLLALDVSRGSDRMTTTERVIVH